MNESLVSIILPTYNGEKYLSAAIESCLSQTYSNIELIIVNDASTDSSEDIILNYAKLDSRVVYVKHDTNKKLPKALNSGFSKSRGSYLTWTSDDNTYKTDAIEKMVNYLVINKNVDFVYANYSIIDANNSILADVHVKNVNTLLLDNGIGPCFLYKREIYESVGDYSEDLFLVEDYDYWLRVSYEHTMQIINTNLYLYRYHDKSLSENNKKKIEMMLIALLEKNLSKHIVRQDSVVAQGYLRLAGLYESNNMVYKALGKSLYALKFDYKLLLNINFYKKVIKLFVK